MTSPERIAKGLYWDRAWSLVRGCTKVSEGCRHCWAERESHMRTFNPNEKVKAQYSGLTDGDGRFNGQIRLMENNLDLPLRVKKPTIWAVWNDLFHEDVPELFVLQAFAVMAETPQHTYLILTKRPERMKDVLTSPTVANDVWVMTSTGLNERKPLWPLPNVFLGVTAENQEQADIRIPLLIKTPAAVKFISVEPMLGPIDVSIYFYSGWTEPPYDDIINLVICGGESGPGARPMHPDWVRSLRDQCQAAGVRFFFKQWGEFKEIRRYNTYSKYADTVGHISRAIGSIQSGRAALLNADGSELIHGGPDHKVYPISHLERVGKKAAGRLLDGQTWDEFPEAVTALAT